MLLCSPIRLGNKLYNLCRHSLRQLFLSASEAATLVERCVSVSVDASLTVRVYGDHAPPTLLFQLRVLCSGARGDAAVLITNEKLCSLCQWGIHPSFLVDNWEVLNYCLIVANIMFLLQAYATASWTLTVFYCVSTTKLIFFAL